MVNEPPRERQRLLPRLAYRDAPTAIEFLCRAFGFEETGRFSQAGKVIYSELALDGEVLFAVGTSFEQARSPDELGGHTAELFCYVDDVDGHHANASAEGAEILEPPEDRFWGDRSYGARDTEGNRWVFRKIVAHVDLPDSRPAASPGE